MITSNTYTARAWGQEDRTAGSMPGASPAPVADSASFSDMVEGADKTKGAADTSETSETAKAGEKHHKKGGFLAFLAAIIDVINPLQHIPVISTIYRHLTGDEISPAARIAGDALYGGPIGAAVGIANVAIEKKTGKDIGGNMMAMLSGKHHKDKEEEPQIANANGQRLQDIAWNDAATKALPPIDIPVNGGAARGTPDLPGHAAPPAAKPDGSGGEMPHIIVPAPRGEDMVAADPAPDSAAAANDDDGSRNALLAFARDMRGGAADAVDVTDQIKQDFRSNPGPAPTKLSYRTGATENEPLAYSYKEGSVQATKSGPATATGKMPAQGMVNVKTALHPQEVPADAGENRAVPPELIAQRMMAGLDQYAAMQRLSSAAGTP
ncbi:MAG TPA: hypothetical protein VEF76_00615 [Patescibacteria group bacterium]|nr:hypothetical protein [Patescibacteria group bacterium]